MGSPYLPDIMQGVVQRVSDAFSNRTVDPFNVFFDKGIYQQVSRNVYGPGKNNFPLVWLVMNFRETMSKDYNLFAEIICNLILVMPTDAKFTQQQRDDITFKPRLLPIYDVLMQEIARERWFQFGGPSQIDHTRIVRPYWGGGDVNGSDTDNLFKKQVDAITISALRLRVKAQNCNPGPYSLNKNTLFPPAVGQYTFYDDLELIVDGGNATDPVAGASSVVIPSLVGKEYNVVQRAFGQLRQERNVEIVQDTINGGFSLTAPKIFSHNDTYFIKIRPILN